jgi:hypothetical protein
MATYSAAEQTKINDTKALAIKLQAEIRNSLSLQASGGSYIANELSKVISKLTDLGAV